VNFPLPTELQSILAETPEMARAFFVGGCVRDAVLGQAPKDFDIEVFGVSYEQLARALVRWGRTDLVGRSFGVVKLTTRSGRTYDFTIPRRDSKVASGHKGFEITFAPDIELPEAAARRDFTINALMFDPRRGEVLDFFGGRADLAAGLLRHTSAAFAEDPLRVLRGMQFAGRFNLRGAPATLALSRSIRGSGRELAVERVREEWFKWAEKSVVPSAGLRFLEQSGWLEEFPELSALAVTPQDPEWHPEGNVFEHTLHCCDALARQPTWAATDSESRIVQMLAVLLHDAGKPECTSEVEREGRRRIVSPGHDEAGVAVAGRFLERIGAPLAVRERVFPLVACHMAHLQEATDRAVRRLAKRLEPETIESLCRVMTADANGRPPLPPHEPKVVRILRAKAAELCVQDRAPKPILLGRHLLEVGLTPGPAMGRILADAFEAQLEGRFLDLAGARRWLAEESHAELTAEAKAALRQ
jgi:tRNA nucleotidyltransferase (CCA-adding enzyme)